MRNEALMSKIAFRQGHVLIGFMVDQNIHETKRLKFTQFWYKKAIISIPGSYWCCSSLYKGFTAKFEIEIYKNILK